MTELKFISNITVELQQVSANDLSVLHAARVSTRGQVGQETQPPEAEIEGLINYLIQHRHGTPFEHNFFQFFVHAPIFVWREWHRHRIGFSYNEESGRYKKLDPVFYMPPNNRPMLCVPNWKPGRPKFLTPREVEGGLEKWSQCCDNLEHSYRMAYPMYEANLELGIDPGLARDCLPVGIYSSCWVSCNARSLMAFLSLRTHDADANKVSYPLYEIEVAARRVEDIFATCMPITYAAFCKHGRQAP
jgi:thymidylate synthase (FAD)